MSEINVGDVVKVRVPIGPVAVDHFGVVSETGIWGDDPRVISKSLRGGGVVEEPLAAFLEGAPLRVDRSIRGRRQAHTIVRAARSRLGEKWRPWDNCEHFVREVHGLRSWSPQLVFGVVVGAIGFLVIGAAGYMYFKTRKRLR